MSSVYLCIPSKRPPEEANPVLQKWKDAGYRIALYCDSQADGEAKTCDIFMAPEESYPGYAQSVNRLVKLVLNDVDTKCSWVVCAGDDTYPDENHSADQIASMCFEHFEGTFGVLQPTGHRWGDANGAYIDRVCGSPFMGRDWCLRINQGNGPLWHQYTHQFVDEELQNVALKYNALWQNPSLLHLHNHWGLPREGERMGLSERMPAFLAEANSGEHWRKFKVLFNERKAAGFPGSEPLP